MANLHGNLIKSANFCHTFFFGYSVERSATFELFGRKFSHLEISGLLFYTEIYLDPRTNVDAHFVLSLGEKVNRNQLCYTYTNLYNLYLYDLYKQFIKKMKNL